MNPTVVQAESALQAAKAAAKANEKADKQKLADIREQLRQAHATYQRLRRQIRNGENLVALHQSRINGIEAQLYQYHATKPACLDLLPDDPECREWAAEYEKLLRQRNEEIAERTRAQAAIPNKAACAKYEGNFGVIANLQRMENNLIRKLRGEPIGATWQGGVYRVG